MVEEVGLFGWIKFAARVMRVGFLTVHLTPLVSRIALTLKTHPLGAHHVRQITSACMGELFLIVPQATFTSPLSHNQMPIDFHTTQCHNGVAL